MKMKQFHDFTRTSNRHFLGGTLLMGTAVGGKAPLPKAWLALPLVRILRPPRTRCLGVS